MKKKYLISEQQFMDLIQLKKDEKVAQKIAEEIHLAKSKLNEGKYLMSSFQDIVKVYKRKGYLTEGVVKKLEAMGIKIKGVL